MFVPIESVKFLDDVSVALVYRDAQRCDPSAVFDYFGMLSSVEGRREHIAYTVRGGPGACQGTVLGGTVVRATAVQAPPAPGTPRSEFPR